MAACDIAGNDFSTLRTPARALKPGETDSTENISLIANVPKLGEFDALDALNSDLAFKGKYAFAGNYNGFMIYDIKRPEHPRIVAQVVCPGSQNDISVYGDLLVLSVDSSRTDDSCASEPLSATDEKDAWEGVRVFDISDPESPQYVAAVETDCGSHTHTLAPDRRQQVPVRLRLVVRAERDVPRLPAAARQDQHRQGARLDAGERVARRRPGALPRRRQPAGRLLARDQRLPRHHGVPVA